MTRLDPFPAIAWPSVMAGLLLAVSAGAAVAADRWPTVQEARLDNGLRMLVVEDHSQPRVACKILTHFGAVVEEPGRLGSAHYLEHLMFKGTATIGTRDWAREQPILQRIHDLEAELIQERHRARRELRQRGVFLDYQRQVTTPRIQALEAEIARAVAENERLLNPLEMMSLYQRHGGARLTATTERDYMKFDINLPSNTLEMFFRVEADRMVNSQWRQFDSERMILWEQRLGDLGRPDTVFKETLASVSGHISPVYWNEGYATDFPLLERHYTRRLYETWFVPNNTILVFVGDTTLPQVERLAREYFGRLPRAAETHDTYAIEPVHQEVITVEMHTPRFGPAIDLRHRIPGVGHPDRPAVELWREILADPRGPLGSRLLAPGPASAVSANTVVTHTDRFSLPATLNIVARTGRDEDLPALRTAMADAVDALGRAPLEERTIAAAKKRRRAAWERRRLNWDDVAFDLGHYEIMDSWRTLFAEMDALQTVTAAQLQAVARKYFVESNRIIGIARRAPAATPAGTAAGR